MNPSTKLREALANARSVLELVRDGGLLSAAGPYTARLVNDAIEVASALALTADASDQAPDDEHAFEVWMRDEAKCIVGSKDPYPAGLERLYRSLWKSAIAISPAPVDEAPAAEPVDIWKAARDEVMIDSIDDDESDPAERAANDSFHAGKLAGILIVKRLLAAPDRAPSTDSATVPAPKFDEAEFDTMVERGTEAWKGVPDDWLEKQRGNVDSATERAAARYRWLRARHIDIAPVEVEVKNSSPGTRCFIAGGGQGEALDRLVDGWLAIAAMKGGA